MQTQALQILRDEIEGLSDTDLDTPLRSLDIDSFGLLSVRARLERLIGVPVDDRRWMEAATPRHMLAFADAAVPAMQPVLEPTPSAGVDVREHPINMPQMAIGGLSESWLFKELGDLHWAMITHGLGAPSSELRDGEGARLYATFSRIRVRLDRSLARYRENEPLRLAGSISRFGSSLFLSEVSIGENSTASLMSTFSRRGDDTTNTSLLKGQPEIGPNCPIETLAALPHFAAEYRAQRVALPWPTIFECEYELVPQHDINGVGLLYFAAYPIIADICETRHAGRDLPFRFSPRERDVHYFANCDPHDTIVCRLHVWDVGDSTIESMTTLHRKSDDTLMAAVRTQRDRTDG